MTYSSRYTQLIVVVIILVAGFFLLVEPSMAVEFDPGNTLGKAVTDSKLSDKSPADFAFALIKGFLSAVGVIALVLIVYGGFLMMLGGTNEERIRQGKDVLFWAVIGTIIILSALTLVQFLDAII